VGWGGGGGRRGRGRRLPALISLIRFAQGKDPGRGRCVGKEKWDGGTREKRKKKGELREGERKRRGKAKKKQWEGEWIRIGKDKGSAHTGKEN
jgi:hypothetical protein